VKIGYPTHNEFPGGVMANDTWRAIQQAITNAMQSRYGRAVGEEALRGIIREAIPHLYGWADQHFHEVWNWFRQTF
jgi:hypothetical protein